MFAKSKFRNVSLKIAFVREVGGGGVGGRAFEQRQ